MDLQQCVGCKKNLAEERFRRRGKVWKTCNLCSGRMAVYTARRAARTEKLPPSRPKTSVQPLISSRTAASKNVSLLVGPESTVIQARKIVLKQAQYFKKIIDNDDKIETIRLPGENPILISTFVKLLEIINPQADDIGDRRQLLKLWALAEKFEAPRLQEVLRLKFNDIALARGPGFHADVLETARHLPNRSPLYQLLVRDTAVGMILNGCHSTGILGRAKRPPMTVLEYANWNADVAHAVMRMAQVPMVEYRVNALDRKAFRDTMIDDGGSPVAPTVPGEALCIDLDTPEVVDLVAGDAEDHAAETTNI